MNDLDQLFAVQHHDTVLDQLTFRRASLPDRLELAQLAERRRVVIAEVARIDRELASMASRQAQLEDDVNQSAAKQAGLRRKLATGSVLREIEALQHEIDGLHERQVVWEDEIFDLMERGEPLEAERAALTAEATALDDRADALRSSLAEADGAIDAEERAERIARDLAAEPVPVGLMARYEKLRARLGGVAVALVTHGHCSGCNLALSTMELEQLRALPAGALPECEQCGRLLHL